MPGKYSKIVPQMLRKGAGVKMAQSKSLWVEQQAISAKYPHFCVFHSFYAKLARLNSNDPLFQQKRGKTDIFLKT